MATEFKAASRIRDFQRSGMEPSMVYATAKVGYMVTAESRISMTADMIASYQLALKEYLDDPEAGDAALSRAA
jgi:hypothetical protein